MSRIPGFYPTWLEAVAPALDTERELATIVRNLDLRPGESVLDLGCGPGRFAPGLARYGCEYTGIDGNADFIEQAPDLDQATYHTADAIDWLANTTRKYDAAFSWLASIGYQGEAADRRLFEAVLGALRPGGRFLIHAFDPTLPSGSLTFVHESKDGPVLVETSDGVDHETNTLTAHHYYLAPPGADGKVTGIFEETRQTLYEPEKLRTMLIEANFESAEFKPAAPPFYLVIGYKA